AAAIQPAEPPPTTRTFLSLDPICHRSPGTWGVRLGITGHSRHVPEPGVVRRQVLRRQPELAQQVRRQPRRRARAEPLGAFRVQPVKTVQDGLVAFMAPQPARIHGTPAISGYATELQRNVGGTAEKLVFEIRAGRRFRSPVVEFRPEPVGDACRALHFPPELVVRATAQAVMHIDEVEDFVEAVGHYPVEAQSERRHVVAVREMLGEHYRREMAQVKPGRLEWFDKAAGQPDRDAVALPRRFANADPELDDPCPEGVAMAALEPP